MAEPCYSSNADFVYFSAALAKQSLPTLGKLCITCGINTILGSAAMLSRHPDHGMSRADFVRCAGEAYDLLAEGLAEAGVPQLTEP